jgi:formate hydrogenlyase subunit 3/multisubunit Na+/H+ antiporter MnhD subunit
VVLPVGVVWGAASLGWGGAALALVGGLGALGEASPRGRGGWWWNVQVGLVLVGLASGTPQGLAGALAAAVSVALGWALQEAGGPWMRRLGGLVAAGSPGTLGFWGPALVVLGALPRLPLAAMAAAVGWALGVGAALRGASEGEKPAEGIAAQELALLGVVVALGFWPGAWLVGLERWALDLASFLHAPGPGWIAFRS